MVESAVSLQSLPPSLLSASSRVSSKDTTEPSTVNMTSPLEGSEGDELRLPLCSCASVLTSLLKEEPPAATLALLLAV